MTKKKKVVSLTLARGGSKEVSRKNIIDLCGRPLISYVLESSLGCDLIDETWVSTDDDEIASVSEKWGGRVLPRPEELATDTAKCEDTLLHFAKNIDFDILAFIQTTSPLVTSGDIEKGIEKVLNQGYDSALSVHREHWIPRWTTEGDPIQWDPANRPRRQMVPVQYVENGAFYITTRDRLVKSGIRYSGKISFIEMSLYKSFQVDSLEDLDLIRKIMETEK